MIIKKPYKGQPLRVRQKTGLDLTGATFVMKAQKPSGAEVSRTCTRVGLTDVVYADFLYTDIDESGEWRFQCFVTPPGSPASYPCKSQIQLIYELYY